MSHSNATPAAVEGWMFKEVTDVVLINMSIYTSSDYARQRLGHIRRKLGMKRITAKTFADFYQMDVYLFYGLK